MARRAGAALLALLVTANAEIAIATDDVVAAPVLEEDDSEEQCALQKSAKLAVPGGVAGATKAHSSEPKPVALPSSGHEWYPQQVIRTIPGVVHVGTFGGTKRGAEEKLKELEATKIINDEVGYGALPITIGIVNDMIYPVFFKGYEMVEGNYFDGPRDGEMALPGQMFVFSAYSQGGGSSGKILLDDGLLGGHLSVSFASYRMGNWFKGCDALRAKADKSKDWDKPFHSMCTTTEYGIHKVDNYLVLVSIKEAE